MKTLADNPMAIAIIGMAGRFPDADDVGTFWQNLVEGRESIRSSSPEELASSGIPEEILKDPRFVSGCGRLDGIEDFDADFFGLNRREAEITSPQQRLLLETSQHALEDAGYGVIPQDVRVGLFAGVETSDYEIEHLRPRHQLYQTLGHKTIQFGNDIAFSATQVAYRLNLTGPAVNVSTACSSSLTAVHMACRSLLSFEAEMALAGGASYSVNQHMGYLYQEGGIGSPDGHCRAFDIDARGTISGNGAGMVLLKRYADALEDGDPVHAVILATAINNDGRNKVGYPAPGLEGQAEVIGEAIELAGVSAEQIGYVEAHGTGTALGDPIEVAALTRAYQETTDKTGFCALGALKSNIGHLGCAAGVSGLIKAALVVREGQIPPTLNVTRPNPKLQLEHTPFTLNTDLRPWPGDRPRIAGVSSFGMGGTNVHAILAAAGESDSRRHSCPGPARALLFSGESPAAAVANACSVAHFAARSENATIEDIAHTLRNGRAAYQYRVGVVARSREDLRVACDAMVSGHAVASGDAPEVAFVFPGQGNQYVGMGAALYAAQPVYRRWVDHCAALLEEHAGDDQAELRGLIASGDERVLEQTRNAQSALFVIEYALAQTLIAAGVQPALMLGHSVGEYVAATLAGVFRLEDALRLIAFRAELMQSMSPGAMLAVGQSANTLSGRLPTGVEIAVVNGPDATVVAGAFEAIDALASTLEHEGTRCRRLRTSHAFHSAAMEPCVRRLEKFISELSLRAPSIPFISNVSGEVIDDAEAVRPGYWAEHTRKPVLFGPGLETLVGADIDALIEVGPGRSVSSNATSNPQCSNVLITAAMSDPRTASDDEVAFHQCLVDLWAKGAAIAWDEIEDSQDARKVHLPGYRFQRRRFWIDRPHPQPASEVSASEDSDQPRLPIQDEQTSDTERAPRPLTMSQPFAAPQGQAEEQIAGIWSELLGVAPVGRNDNFFELGGGSLLMVQLATRVRDVFSVQVAANEFFALQTVAEIAQQITRNVDERDSEIDNLADEFEGLSEVEQAQLLAELEQVE